MNARETKIVARLTKEATRHAREQGYGPNCARWPGAGPHDDQGRRFIYAVHWAVVWRDPAADTAPRPGWPDGIALDDFMPDDLHPLLGPEHADTFARLGKSAVAASADNRAPLRLTFTPEEPPIAESVHWPNMEANWTLGGKALHSIEVGISGRFLALLDGLGDIPYELCGSGWRGEAPEPLCPLVLRPLNDLGALTFVIMPWICR